MVEGLRACGVDAEELPDGLVVRGQRPQERSRRLPASARSTITASPCLSWCWAWRRRSLSIVDDAEMIDTSFPGFVECMQQPGRRYRRELSLHGKLVIHYAPARSLNDRCAIS